jgi:hypothetical protein
VVRVFQLCVPNLIRVDDVMESPKLAECSGCSASFWPSWPRHCRYGLVRKSRLSVSTCSIDGMAHGVPLATEENCGSAGAFFLDVGISSTRHIARFWSLHESLVERPQAAAPVPATARSLVTAEAAAEDAHSSAEASPVHGEERQKSYPLDPNAVIAAAFRDAGLPVPEVPITPGTPPHVAPGPIIAAALKAAGLLQS